MIVTVTLNAALDITYCINHFRRYGSNRVSRTFERAGGKGVNVARVLASLGHSTVVTGFAGGATGQSLRSELESSGLRDEMVSIAGASRRTVAVTEEHLGEATLYLEPGPTVSVEEWLAFLVRYDSLLSDAEAVVLSGSLPPGLAPTAYRDLLRRAHAAGVPAILDAEGLPLRNGLAARPTLVKPNSTELMGISSAPSLEESLEDLRRAGAQSVVASLGPDGMLASSDDGIWSAAPPQDVRGNPTGAGDAAVAALTVGLIKKNPWPEMLANAIALSAATVFSPVAGSYDAAEYVRMKPRVRVVRHKSSST